MKPSTRCPDCRRLVYSTPVTAQRIRTDVSAALADAMKSGAPMAYLARYFELFLLDLADDLDGACASCATKRTTGRLTKAGAA